MAVVNKIIHRFVRNRAEYFDPENELYNQIIPYNVQAYSYELKEGGDPRIPDDYIVRYVLGTGRSTYQQIADGQGRDSDGNLLPELSKEFIVNSNTQLIELINNLIQSQYIVANYITSNASGDAFATKADLDAAETWYYAGEVVTPKKNDYVIVIADETHPTGTGDPQTVRYICTDIVNGIPVWNYEYVINNGNFTPGQQAAIDSGITAEKVEQYDNYADQIAEALDHLTDYNNPHRVTAEQIGLGNVDNTSDADKPVSTAVQEALDSLSTAITTHTENEDIHVTAAEKESWSNKQDPIKMGNHISINNNTINVLDNLATYDNSISQFVNKDVDNLTNYYNKEELGGIYKYIGDVETKEDLPDGNIYAPTEYTELLYLSADQLEYIDTHYHPNQNTKIVVKFNIDGESNNYLYGTDVDHESNKVAFGNNYGAATSTLLFGNKSINYIVDNQVHTLVQDKSGVYVDNEAVGEYTGINDFITESTLWLFRAQSLNTHPQNVNIYDFAIYEGDLLVKHYVPVERDADNALGMYECIDEEFKQNEYNPEEFDFIAGPYAGYGVDEGTVYKVINEDAFYMWHDNEWIEINRFYKAGTGIEIAQDSTINNTFDVLVDGESVVENAVATIDLTGKVDKTSEASKVYGTDEDGNQTLYSAEAFGKVDDVQLNGVSVVENKIANIEPEAGDVEYHNEAVVSITNVQQALDNLMNIHYYVEPTYSTFTVSQSGTYDVGRTLSKPFTVNWTLNKQPETGDTQTLKLDNAVVLNIMNEDRSQWKSGTYSYTAKDLTSSSPKTFTFRVDYTDNHSEVPQGKSKTCNKTATMTFYYRRFYGVTTTETLSDEQLLALTNELSNSRAQTRDFNCSGGKFWWIVIPTTYCSGIQFTDVGSGLPMTLPASCISTRSITNSYGVSYNVNVYRGEYKQTASSVKIKVS